MRDGVRFEEVVDLYVFDRRLRLLALEAIEQFEVALRAAITDHMAISAGDAFWYTAAESFRSPEHCDRVSACVDEVVKQQLRRAPENVTGDYAHRSALEHYVLKYASPDLPPSWVAFEHLTLGQLRLVLVGLRRSDKEAVARVLGLREPLLMSWLKSFQRVRNICAHHGRLWNVVIGVYPKIPASSSVVG